ncbi:RNA-binding protein [Paraburkholderia terrae]|jgi:bifunctional DNA-binding transcriptional regulator/antitoxin component of YhaV-PrlF toxin-antitoxin module|uniref:SpoVT-AbrB domain-containing protein n=1 Tax=Paraburkholderia caribensis TaxID=75105 RepID=A0ABV0DN15_9BURK|nr:MULTISPECIES: hypothetical protein [Paraburkholderia]MCO4875589.1 RNA-binding protein [Paraburkholderia caribensis]MDW3658703.1 hypothetical protein [Paraburkholderia terrae]
MKARRVASAAVGMHIVSSTSLDLDALGLPPIRNIAADTSHDNDLVQLGCPFCFNVLLERVSRAVFPRRQDQSGSIPVLKCPPLKDVEILMKVLFGTKKVQKTGRVALTEQLLHNAGLREGDSVDIYFDSSTKTIILERSPETTGARAPSSPDSKTRSRRKQ